MIGAEIVQRFAERGVALTPAKTERGISITHGVRTAEIEVPVKRKSGGTVIERHQVERPWYSVFANGNLLAHFNEDEDVDPSVVDEASRLAVPLPHEVMHPLCKKTFTAIGIVGMEDSENALQLAKVVIADGKVVSMEPLFSSERERDSFAFARLESTLVGWSAAAYAAGDFRGVVKEKPGA
jgi:hypothetical protein